MRVGFGAALGVGHADHLKQGHCTLPTRLFAQVLMDVEHFGKLIADLENGVQGRLRLLKDHRDAVPAHLDHFLFGQFEQVFPIQ